MICELIRGLRRLGGGPSDESSIIVSSEPLSEDRATWLEVPEYTMIAATLRDGVVAMSSSSTSDR